MHKDLEHGNGKYLFAVSGRTEVSIERVWETLGDFGNEHEWTGTLLYCERDTPTVHVGTSRSCTLTKPLMGRTQVREELIEFSPGEALMYKLDGPAGPFRTAASRWSTGTDAEGNTVITVEGHFTPRNKIFCAALWPLMKPYIMRVTAGVLKELNSFLALQKRMQNEG